MPRTKVELSTCTVDGCEQPAKSTGLCRAHYQMHWRYGRTEKVNRGDKRSHPLYMVWWERKKFGSLCPEWAADFWAMVASIGDPPSPTHLLRPLRSGEPYGPDNFEWMDALKRQPGETRKAFNARKWASRRQRFPEYEGHRSLKRKYGITPEQYREMLEEQDHKCAICRQPETRLSPKTNAPQGLAVDHCHGTKKVRSLLCWRCNTTIGKVDESVELLRDMIAYLQKFA